MKLREHLKIIDNPVVLEVLDENKVLYRGYKGCFEYEKDSEKISDREVECFKIRVEARRRSEPQEEMTVITELNCGKFNYCDLYEELVYSYRLAKKK